MFIGKLDAARRQLSTAIKLWFSGADPVSIHSLAYASHEIIHRLYRRKGLDDLLYDSKALTDEQRSEFPRLLKESANFFKHATREQQPDAEAFFSPYINELFLIFSTIGLLRMGEKLNETESAFVFWLYLRNPGWFVGDQTIKEHIPPEHLDEIRAVANSEFLNAFATLKSGLASRDYRK